MQTYRIRALLLAIVVLLTVAAAGWAATGGAHLSKTAAKATPSTRDFKPSERIRAGQAVAFPANI